MSNTTAEKAPAPATEPAAPRRANRLAMLPVVVFVVLVAAAAIVPLSPPAVQPASASPTHFSAARALSHLPGLATRPHPTGSTAQNRVTDYLVGTLRDLGLTPQEQTRTASQEFPDGAVYAGTVTNVFATIPGRRSTGLVLLVAHYDSVPTGPGAADNGSNVAALLETVRALRAGPQPRNDLGVLFTDAEEQGLLGAKAFVDSRAAGDPDRVVALNLDARGVSGPAIMFEMAGPGLTPALRASGAVSSSLAPRLYQMLPNNTDLTVLRAAGMRGLNFAYIDGVEHYHSAHDDIAHLDGRSVQAMGDAILGATRQLADADLAAGGPAMTYFPVLGTLVAYPSLLDLPLTGLAAVGFAVLLYWGRRRGLSLRAVGRAAVGLPLCVVAAAVAVRLVSQALLLVRPDLTVLNGGVYGWGWYALAEAALVLVALTAWYRWARRTATGTEVAVAVTGVFVLCSLVCVLLFPAATYLFAWPALLGVAAGSAVLRAADPAPVRRAAAAWRAAAACAPAAAALPLIAPIMILLEPQPFVTGLADLRVLLATLLGATVLPVLQRLPSPRPLTAAMVAVAVVAAGSIVTLAVVDDYGRARPRPVSLGYVLDADTGSAMWVSTGGTEQPVVGRLVGGRVQRLDASIPQLGGRDLHTGPAQTASALLPGAHAVVSATQESAGMRTLHVRMTFPGDAYSYAVFADTSGHQIVGASVDGAPLPVGTVLSPAAGAWGWGFGYAGPPPTGSELTLRVRGNGPLRIRVVTTIASLPSGVGAPDLPPDLSWTSWPSVGGGQTFVVNTYRI